MHTPGLFDLTDHPERLSATGDPLEALKRHVDFKTFRPVLIGPRDTVSAPKVAAPYDPSL